MCREQRLTGILVFVLTGLSIFLAPVLQVSWQMRHMHERGIFYVTLLVQLHQLVSFYTIHFILLCPFCCSVYFSTSPCQSCMVCSSTWEWPH